VWYSVGDFGEIMNYKFTIGRRARLIENIINNYEIIDLDTYSADKPIVLVFGGNGTTDDRSANGNAKIVSSMLGVFNDDVDILSVNYNQALGEQYIINNCKELINKLLLPLVSKDGTRIDIVNACKNMRKITVFAHCRGVDGIMRRLIPVLKQELSNLQYNDTEIKCLISQIVMVAYGANFKDIITDVKGVYCLSFCDDMFPNGAVQQAKQFITKLDIINMVKTDRDMLKQINFNKPAKAIYADLIEFLKLHRRVYNSYQDNNIRLFAYGLIQTDNHIWEQDHSIHAFARDDYYDRHENASSTGDCISRCLACALCNSVANGIINQRYNEFIDFDMNKLNLQMEDICKAHNYEQTKLDNVDLELYY
jgi:hypothetical protein